MSKVLMVIVELRCTSDMQQACYTFNIKFEQFTLACKTVSFFLKIGLA